MKETVEVRGDPYDSAITVMDRYGITRMTLLTWTKEGLPKPIKLGKRLFYNRRDIENYLLQSNN
jgi:predicted site-specific integrase-resolvase